jgi:hypothetical protein
VSDENLAASCILQKTPNFYFFTTQRSLITSPLTGGRRRSSLPPRFGHPQACSDPARLCSGHPPGRPVPATPQVAGGRGRGCVRVRRRRPLLSWPASGKKRAAGAGEEAGDRRRGSSGRPAQGGASIAEHHGDKLQRRRRSVGCQESAPPSVCMLPGRQGSLSGGGER